MPDGFVVLPSAFENETLTSTAREQIIVYLEAMRRDHAGAYFAVRSSARSEDSASASFAGEFETRLNLKSNEEILDAIMTVFRSRDSERVKAYSSVHNLLHVHEIAVVVQLMVPAEIAGVLFTADPITGSYASMFGNFVYGLGEQLVSGETDAHSFRLLRPRGKYEGPNDFKRYASRLYQLAAKLEKELDAPQDLEWAITQGKLYLLQARPITTLTVGNLETYEINESLSEDALWVNTNVAEAVPDVFSPLTWSLVRGYDIETNYIPGYYVWSGNIYGRVYSNISRRVSVTTLISGMSVRRVMGLLGDLFGPMPEEMTVPIRPGTRFDTLREVLPRIMRVVRKKVKGQSAVAGISQGYSRLVPRDDGAH